MLRAGYDLESPEVGGVPLNTELHVRERLRLADGTMRIHVCRLVCHSVHLLSLSLSSSLLISSCTQANQLRLYDRSVLCRVTVSHVASSAGRQTAHHVDSFSASPV